MKHMTAYVINPFKTVLWISFTQMQTLVVGQTVAPESGKRTIEATAQVDEEEGIAMVEAEVEGMMTMKNVVSMAVQSETVVAVEEAGVGVEVEALGAGLVVLDTMMTIAVDAAGVVIKIDTIIVEVIPSKDLLVDTDLVLRIQLTGYPLHHHLQLQR